MKQQAALVVVSVLASAALALGACGGHVTESVDTTNAPLTIAPNTDPTASGSSARPPPDAARPPPPPGAECPHQDGPPPVDAELCGDCRPESVCCEAPEPCAGHCVPDCR